MSEFILHSINISTEKGTKKFPIKKVIVKKGIGIAEDAHRGMKNREISLLSREAIDAFKPDLANGSFAENITTSGLDLSNIKLLDYIKVGNVLLQISKIGKECHDRCHIYKAMGECIMPKKGVFCKVLKGGTLNSGAKAAFLPKTYKAAVITLSDRASQNIYQDESGEVIREELDKHFVSTNRQWTLNKIVIPDSKIKLWFSFYKLLFQKYDLIISTGGTGISKRDITIDVARSFIKKDLPGITEFIRNKYGQNNRNALISRSLVGVNAQTLICCLPGSAKAVKEYMEELTPMLNHLFFMLFDVEGH